MCAGGGGRAEVGRADGDGSDADEQWASGSFRSLGAAGADERGREENALSHRPVRSWCRHRVRGRGSEWPHKSDVEELCLLGDEVEPGRAVTVPAMREQSAKMMLVAAVPAKTRNSHIARRIAAFMREVGAAFDDMLAKTDQEPAIREDVGRARVVAPWGE